MSYIIIFTGQACIDMIYIRMYILNFPHISHLYIRVCDTE